MKPNLTKSQTKKLKEFQQDFRISKLEGIVLNLITREKNAMQDIYALKERVRLLELK